MLNWKDKVWLDFLKYWKKEAESENPSHTIKMYGLCYNFKVYMHNNDIPSLGAYSFVRLKTGYHGDYPFNSCEGEYNNDFNSHLNLKRVAFVDAQIAELESQQ